MLKDIRFYLKTEHCKRGEKIAPFLGVKMDLNENGLGPFYKSCRAAPNHRNLSSTEVRLGAPLLFYKNKTFVVLCRDEP